MVCLAPGRSPNLDPCNSNRHVVGNEYPGYSPHSFEGVVRGSLSRSNAKEQLILHRRHRREVGALLRSVSGRTRAEAALLLFVESGLLYCLLWVWFMNVMAQLYRFTAADDRFNPIS